MTQDEVLSIMRSSGSEAEWDANCNKVKAAHKGGYPPYWFKEIIQARLYDQLFGPGAGDIKIVYRMKGKPHGGSVDGDTCKASGHAGVVA